MSNVPAEVSAYFSKIAKDGAQNLSPEARRLRAQGAAEARWARARAQARIDSAADQIRSQHTHLSHAQAVAEALKQDPSLYSEYSAAHDQVGSATPLQLAAEAHEIEQVCALAGRPDLAHIFVEQSVPARAVIEFFLQQQKEEEKSSSAGKVSMPKSPVSNGGAKVSTGNSRNWRPSSSPTTPTRRLRVVTPWLMTSRV
jgi:hypothetical protein